MANLSSRVANQAAASTVKQSPVHAGVVMAFAGSAAPAGWHLCDGTALSQTTYADLYAAIGSTWDTKAKQDGGGGNWAAPTAGTFRVPDLRGVFLRGVGTSSDSSGNGDVSVTLGGFQSDDFKAHNHPLVFNTVAGTAANGNYLSANTMGTSAAVAYTANVAVQNSGGTETRPRNVGVQYIIKLYNDSIDLAGLAEVQPGSTAGLVSASGLKGRTDGTGIAAGYVGEKIASGNWASYGATSTSFADITSATITLTAGVWRIYYSVSVNVSTGSATGNDTRGVVTITDSANTAVGNSQRGLYVKTVAATSAQIVGNASAEETVNITATTTYKLRARKADGSGTGSVTINASNDGDFSGCFYAVRIA